jgi:hypothetical protein
MDIYVPSLNASLIDRTTFFVSITLLGSIFLYQIVIIIVWPTAYKQTRYMCLENPSKTCPDRLIILIFEFLLEIIARGYYLLVKIFEKMVQLSKNNKVTLNKNYNNLRVFVLSQFERY